MNLRRMKQAIRREVYHWISESVGLTGKTLGEMRVEVRDPFMDREGYDTLGARCWAACESPSTWPAQARFHRAMLEVAGEMQ